MITDKQFLINKARKEGGLHDGEKPLFDDNVTREYRIHEFKKVSTEYGEYKPMIKIIKPDGETKWINIEEEELKEVIKVLTK